MALTILLATLIGIAGGCVITAVARPARLLPPKHRSLLDDAASLLHRLRNPTDLDQIDVLSDPSKRATDRWLARYNKEFD